MEKKALFLLDLNSFGPLKFIRNLSEWKNPQTINNTYIFLAANIIIQKDQLLVAKS